MIHEDDATHEHFLDLLRALLEYDPKKYAVHAFGNVQTPNMLLIFMPLPDFTFPIPPAGG